MDKSVSELITEIEQELHQVAGPATQVYSQDMLISRINDAFISFFEDKEVLWKRFLHDATYTLDGASGCATVQVDGDFEYNHIFRVYPSNSDRPLGKWNLGRNPSLITGSQPIFVRPAPTAASVFQILPVTATGDVVVVGKWLAATGWPYSDLDSVVKFDYLAIKYYVAWQELSDEGSNPVATDDMLKKFQNRYKQLEAAQGQEPVPYSGGTSQYPTQWRDSDA